MEKSQSKYFYTAELMNKALLVLLEKKDLEFITITEITKKAGVNRSTFYLHYENVYELLEETIENLHKQFVNSFKERALFEIKTKEESFFITDERLIPYLKFVKENKRVLKLIHQKPQLFQAKKTYQQMYDKFFYPAISKFITKENERIYKLEYYTAGVVAIINKWIELDCVTEMEELVKIIKNCIGYNEHQNI